MQLKYFGRAESDRRILVLVKRGQLGVIGLGETIATL
jgi:hypothetical protein